MKYINIANGGLKASEISLGCMRISGMSDSDADTLIHTAVDEGINFFDHADIYGGGKSEEIFGRVLAKEPGLRSKLLIQTKCGIRSGYYDFSKEHIINSVRGIFYFSKNIAVQGQIHISCPI